MFCTKIKPICVGILLCGFLAFLPAPGASADDVHGMLDGLTLKRDAASKRISSFDQTGGNADRIQIDPGAKALIADIKGAGVIKHIWMTIAHSDKLYRRMLVIRMYWDGEENPSVEAPIGDFFGQGWGEEYHFISMPLAAGPTGGRGLNCYFPMPFAKGAKIEVENQSEKKCDALYFYIDYEEHKRLSRDQLRFHAWYNQEITEPWKGDENEWNALRQPADENPTDENNYLIIDAEGEGHYVGVNYYVNCPSPMWYGEGDDMWSIDGEAWPFSLHGTGTEDYFNSSWCPKEIYMHPFFGYPRVNNKIGWMGRTHCYRFHVQEPVIFKKSLRGSIEHGHANSMTEEIATVAYWYQKEPHKPFPPLAAAQDRIPKPEIDLMEIHRWRNAWREKMGNGVLWGNEN
ncbi:MAG: glycoside hydrolase family 172 protein [Candidatus Hinthialibacter sp.]